MENHRNDAWMKEFIVYLWQWKKKCCESSVALQLEKEVVEEEVINEGIVEKCVEMLYVQMLYVVRLW